MKATLLCHHLYLNGSRFEAGQQIEIHDHHAKAILSADDTAGRQPRIKLAEQPKTTLRRKKAVKNENRTEF